MLKNFIQLGTVNGLRYQSICNLSSSTITSFESKRSYCKITSLSTDVSEDPMFYYRHPRLAKDIYIIGTAHVSRRSAHQVKSFIQGVKPTTVALELCQKRYDKFKKEQNIKNIEPYQSPQQMSSILQEIMKMIAQGRFNPGDLLEIIMKNFYNSFRVLGIIPGLEFKFAIDEAEAVGANIVLGDLPIQDSMSGLANALLSELLPMLGMGKPDLRSLASLLGNFNMNNNGGEFQQTNANELRRLTELLSPLINVLTKSNITEEELDREFKKFLNRGTLKEIRSIMIKIMPKVTNTLLIEREKFMVNTILNCKGDKILAVVGALHVEGIKDLLVNMK